jgi:hypothetical protein
MKKTRKRRPTPEEKVVTIINKMFEIAGHKVTYDDIKDRKDAWYADWTMTVAQDEEWKKWMQEYFIKECKMVKGLVSREAAMISLMWGLKLSDYES